MDSSAIAPESRTYGKSYPGYSRDYRQTGVLADVMGAYSGDNWDRSGGGCCCGGGYSGGSSASGLFSDGTLLALLAAAGLAFYVLYTAVTAAAAARRKRRSLKNGGGEEDEDILDFADVIFGGLEEFEEKIDRIADGNGGDDQNSWISDLYNQFAGQYGDVDNSLKESDLEGLEPPLLDETWGLGLRNQKNATASTTVEDAVTLEEKEGREKRSADTEEVAGDDEEKCRVDMWRCLSSVIEGSLHYLDKPEGLMGVAKKTMFKMAFHGGLGSAWSGVMNIPEARRVKKCMTSHQECISYEVLRREAANNLDPTDPDYELYVKINEEKAAELKRNGGKRERILVNPEYVQSLDQSDGTEE